MTKIILQNFSSAVLKSLKVVTGQSFETAQQLSCNDKQIKTKQTICLGEDKFTGDGGGGDFGRSGGDGKPLDRS